MDKAELVSFIEALDRYAVICAIIVAVGVAGEGVVGYLHWTKGRRLHEIEEAENLVQRQLVESARADAAKAAAEVANATRGIEEARLAAAQANERAAEANRLAEVERLARVKLEHHMTQRSLTSEQIGAIAAAIAPFKGQAISITSIMGDADGDRYKRDFAVALRRGGWIFDDATLESQSVMTPVPTGVQVTVNATDVQPDPNDAHLVKALPPSAALATVLEKLGLSTGIFGNDRLPKGGIALIVGVKPSMALIPSH